MPAALMIARTLLKLLKNQPESRRSNIKICNKLKKTKKSSFLEMSINVSWKKHPFLSGILFVLPKQTLQIAVVNYRLFPVYKMIDTRMRV